MEKDNLKIIFDIFREELVDDIWSKFFFISLCDNLWYYKEEDTIFSFSDTQIIGDQLSKYRRKNFFKDDTTMDYYIFMSGNHHKWGYISSRVSECENYKKFIVLTDNEKNREYIRSISRDNKIKEIIK